jgi:tetratricopeptide (TPR) repeat protein
VDERERGLRNKKGKEMWRTPRSLTALFRQYLHRQMAAQAEGLGLADPDGQVVPYEAVPMQPVDPRLAWEDALAVVRFSQAPSAGAGNPIPAPPDWPSLVAAQEPAIALAFCIGNFPQMVRNVQPLLAGGDLSALRRVPTRPVSVSPTLLQWASTTRGYPQLFVAAGILRLARRFKEACDIFVSNREAPAGWQALRANEEAALAWHRGNAEEALALWQAQKTSLPVLFNRGMATLFLGRATEARTALNRAVAQLPETSAWFHLGQLYLALIAARC